MNLSSLSHPITQARIYVAMRYAVNASRGLIGHCQRGKFQIAPDTNRGTVYLQNKKGNNFLRVTYDRAENGRLSGFRFYGEDGDCTSLVLQSLRA